MLLRPTLIALLCIVVYASTARQAQEQDTQSPAGDARSHIHTRAHRRSAGERQGARAAKPPHIVLIVADDLGWNDVGYHNVDNENVIRTPNIDRLSAEGVRLENYYVQPICTPTRSVLLSGKYQIHTGLQHGIIAPTQANALGTQHRLLSEQLKGLGYSTHMVGKWHLGHYKKKYLPPHRGFDTFYGFWTGSEYYFTHQAHCWSPGHDLGYGLDFFEQDKPVRDAVGKYSTNLFTERAVDIIAEHDTEEPLFLYLSYQAVHGPLQAPDWATAMFRDATPDSNRMKLAAMAYVMDRGIGNVTQALKDKGIYDDTIIVFTSDNGGWWMGGASNYPYRGEKGGYWEGGIKSVGFVHSPLLGETGVVRNGLMHVADWFPTLVHLANGSTAELHLDGVDQWDMISHGEASSRQEILFNIDPVGRDLDPAGGTKLSVIRGGDYKLLVGNPSQELGQDAWRLPPGYKPRTSDISKLHHDESRASCRPCVFTKANITTGMCLFDLAKDRLEKCDVSQEHPDIVEQLLERLSYYNSTAVPARYPPADIRSTPTLYNNTYFPWGDLVPGLP